MQHGEELQHIFQRELVQVYSPVSRHCCIRKVLTANHRQSNGLKKFEKIIYAFSDFLLRYSLTHFHLWNQSFLGWNSLFSKFAEIFHNQKNEIKKGGTIYALDFSIFLEQGLLCSSFCLLILKFIVYNIGLGNFCDFFLY